MGFSAHAQELRQKHAQLDASLKKEMKRPAADPLRIAQIKKQKLQLKDRIIALG